MTKWSLGFLVGVCVLLQHSISVAEIYRYRDAAGNTVLDRQGVPAQFIGQGYEVLSNSGQVVRVVPRALTPEEHLLKEQEQQQLESDRQLLRLYSRPEDLERAKNRKLSEVDGQIRLAEGSLQAAKSQRERIQQQAAGHERAGNEVPHHLIVQIEDFTRDEKRLSQQVSSYLLQRQALVDNFELQRKRLLELLAK